MSEYLTNNRLFNNSPIYTEFISSPYFETNRPSLKKGEGECPCFQFFIEEANAIFCPPPSPSKGEGVVRSITDEVEDEVEIESTDELASKTQLH